MKPGADANGFINRRWPRVFSVLTGCLPPDDGSMKHRHVWTHATCVNMSSTSNLAVLTVTDDALALGHGFLRPWYSRPYIVLVTILQNDPC